MCSLVIFYTDTTVDRATDLIERSKSTQNRSNRAENTQIRDIGGKETLFDPSLK